MKTITKLKTVLNHFMESEYSVDIQKSLSINYFLVEMDLISSLIYVSPRGDKIIP